MKGAAPVGAAPFWHPADPTPAINAQLPRMILVRSGYKSLAVVAALLLAVGLAACGGGDSSSTATEAAAQEQMGSSSSRGASTGDKAKKGDGGEGKSGGSSGEGESSSGGSSNFVPKHHKDSGGGSEQFRVKGGDNSVQEFGGEADASELDEAATVLHNFLDARAAGDWAAACAYMSSGVVDSFKQLAAQGKQVKDTSCAGILEALTNPAAKQAMQAEAEQADVVSLRTEGEQAFVIYTAIGTVYAMPMANEDGDWKVASLAGTPLN